MSREHTTEHPVNRKTVLETVNPIVTVVGIWAAMTAESVVGKIMKPHREKKIAEQFKTTGTIHFN